MNWDAKLKVVIFGKYDLKSIFEKHRIPGERLIAEQDILYYSEIPLFLALIIGIVSLFLSLLLDPIFLVGIPIIILITYFSISMEFVFLTDERILIERRYLLDKILSTRTIINIALDQISIVESGRAPPNWPVSFVTMGTLLLSVFSAMITSNVFTKLIWGYVGLISTFILIYSLRLFRRAVSLFVVGSRLPIVIGARKGISVYWVKKLHETLFERIHHVEHIYSSHKELDTKINEFPLELPQNLKKVLVNLSQNVEKEIYKLLYFEPRTKKELYSELEDFDNHLIDNGLSHLSKEGMIVYDRSRRVWTITGKVPNS